MIIALVAPNEYGKIYNINFHVMKEIIIEVRTNITSESDVGDYKAAIKSQLFGKAFKSCEKISGVDKMLWTRCQLNSPQLIQNIKNEGSANQFETFNLVSEKCSRDLFALWPVDQ